MHELSKVIIKRIHGFGIDNPCIPPFIVSGKVKPFEDIGKRIRTNTQVVIAAYEFKKPEWPDPWEEIKRQLHAKFGIDFLLYKCETYDETLEVINELLAEFNVAANPQDLIERVPNNRNEETYFYLYIGEVKMPYYI